ncbi:MAG TPA: hypothetical protein PKL15_00745 [Saprospiraceae bacterium]|nr:hypothetical protein [Saprospiraceae bacterium]
MAKESVQELLKKVRPTEAPPFLLTRIEARLRAEAAERLPRSWQWAGALAFGALLLLNALTLRPSGSTSTDTAGSLMSYLQINSSNQLYADQD